jgi:DNA mismatch repair protein MutS
MIVAIRDTKDMANVQFKNDFKKTHNAQSTIVMFRTGDAYKVYDEDAKVCGEKLNKEVDGDTLAFPCNMLDVYLPRLVRMGYRIAIAEQQ